MKNKKHSIIALSMALLIIFGTVAFTGCNKNKKESKPSETTNNITEAYKEELSGNNASDETEEAEETEIITEVVTNEEGETEIITEVITKEIKTTKKTDKNTTKATTEKAEKITTAKNDKTTTRKSEKTTSSEPASKEEIVALFNKSANAIKTDATKVVKNFEKRIVNEDKTVIPAAIESTAESMMKSLMGDDTKPTTFATKDEIRENFIVPQQDYVSKLTSDYVVKYDYQDKGDTAEIYLKLKDHKNPTAGIGVGAVCDVIETHEIAEKASFIKEFATTYYDCEITATMDKATGRITHIVYSTPLVMNMTVNLFGTHSGSIGFTFVKDYTVTY